MPTSTLRIWERRYNVVNPSRSTAGQRLYSRLDVQRLVLLKALSERGHAIGAVATLTLHELEGLARESVFTESPVTHAESVVGIGPGWARPPTDPNVHQQWQLYTTIAAAKMASLPRPTDVLLVREPSLHADTAIGILRVADRCAARSVLVAYAFASQGCVERLQASGVRLHREMGQPADSAVLLAQALSAPGPAGQASASSDWQRAKRRFSDAQLASVAKAAAVVACECPRHVADMISQLSAFEDYSDDCIARGPEDAVLHRYLGDIANSARQLFETALERLAETEGLQLGDTESRKPSAA